MEFSYNCVVIGQTGVGKSSFVNYLFGEPIAITGIGKPVTERGFHKYHGKVNNIDIEIFDSWGLEVGKEKEWMELAEQELKARGVEKKPQEWFHSIFYCINASSSRVQNEEIKIIKKFIDAKYIVNVIFTKSDTTDEKTILEMTKTVKKDIDIPCIPVCSEERKQMGGGKVNAFGKDDVIKQMLDDFWPTIIKRMPGRLVSVINEKIDEWANKQDEKYKKWFENSPLIGRVMCNATPIIYAEAFQKKFIEDFNSEFNSAKFNNIIEEEIKEVIEMYSKFNSQFVVLFSLSDLKITNDKYYYDNSWLNAFLTLTFIVPILSSIFFDIHNYRNEIIQKILTEIKSKVREKEPEFKNMLINLRKQLR